MKMLAPLGGLPAAIVPCVTGRRLLVPAGIMNASKTRVQGQAPAGAGQTMAKSGPWIIRSLLTRLSHSQRLPQFIKFCMVGGSGTVVDMVALYLLADPKSLGLNLTLSKVCAAETALVNNFLWNDLWTFRRTNDNAPPRGIFRRLLLFNAICGSGIVFAVVLLHVFHTWLGWNLYISNLLAILIVTLWNFGMNARYNWGAGGASGMHAARGPTSRLVLVAAAALFLAGPPRGGKSFPYPSMAVMETPHSRYCATRGGTPRALAAPQALSMNHPQRTGLRNEA